MVVFNQPDSINRIQPVNARPAIIRDGEFGAIKMLVLASMSLMRPGPCSS